MFPGPVPIHHPRALFWPLALILWGVLLLAERAALEVEGYPDPYTGAPYQGAPTPGTPQAGAPPAPASTSIVPANSDDYERGSNGGRS